jgi:two-component system OmpR family response regulator/two-component system response regulator RstA
METTHQSTKLFLVEDDLELAAMVSEFLTNEGYEVSTESNGRVAAERIVKEDFDVVLLDIGLPELDGISICRITRDKFQGPIIMLTARGDEIDEVVALEVGADDFMSKPVRPRALLARLKVHIKRTKQVGAHPSASRIELNGLVIDANSRNVRLKDTSNNETKVALTTAEFDLLWFLAERAGQVVPRNDIYKEIQGVEYDGLDRSIDLRISRLRKKLNDDPHDPERIKSVRGVGYILAIES